MTDWAIGLSTGCFWESSIFECLEDIRYSGFSRIEVCSAPTHLDYHDIERVRCAGTLIEKLGLETYSYHAPFSERIDITSPDRHLRDFARDELFQAVEAAAILKARNFVIHPGPESPGGAHQEHFSCLHHGVDVLNQIYAHCRRFGVALVLENMLPHLVTGKIRDLLWIFGALDTFKVGLCLDTGHAHLTGDLPGIVHKMAGHLWMVHANDNNRQFDDHLPPGDGSIHWQPVLSHLNELGFNGTFVIELSSAGGKQQILEGARRGRTFLRDLSHRLRVPV